jgi:hypothetical protein
MKLHSSLFWLAGSCWLGFAVNGCAVPEPAPSLCGANECEATGGSADSGGSASTGGSVANSGGTITGGTAQTGGTSAPTGGASGGVTSSGGALNSSGGTTSSGGSVSTGGIQPSNGGSPTGGTTSQGGTSSKGGASATGGTVGSGSSAGSISSGGSATTGGKAGTGGTAGGNAPTGGTGTTGGTSTGGLSTGGTSTGGTSTGGKATGGSGQVVELAQGKPATAKTVQAANPVTNGNDGLDTTRFCAANGNTGNWWRVDLGAVHTLTRIEVMWEFARQYNYLVEVSADDQSYTTAVDRSTTTDSAQTQTLPFSGTARYVRITATALPTQPPTWMSFFEVKVYGM